MWALPELDSSSKVLVSPRKSAEENVASDLPSLKSRALQGGELITIMSLSNGMDRVGLTGLPVVPVSIPWQYNACTWMNANDGRDFHD